ncbi:MAG: 50S ribosomal protein L14 [Candidatus Nomurabacteria bacterium GW2011_GWF2_35_66]|nr:MAG: 50S ribosomal protein L14 [Candidatus Nomurabacteria bacterium GW2011_GWF2_35_66]
MIQDGTVVNITDNAGGKVGKVFAGIGDKVIISVKIAEPRKGVKKKDVCQAVVVRTVKSYRRKDGSYIRFDDNAVVILEKDKQDPKGGRVFGPIPRELAERGYQKIISLAQEVI